MTQCSPHPNEPDACPPDPPLCILSGEEIIELNADLIAVAQLIDGWRADSAWTKHDEDVRYRVHVQLSRLNNMVPMDRAAFSQPSQ